MGKSCRARVSTGGIMVRTEAGCLHLSGAVGFGGGRSGRVVSFLKQLSSASRQMGIASSALEWQKWPRQAVQDYC